VVRQAAEVSATQQIHTIQAAQEHYFSKFGRYAASLADPRTDLASGVKGDTVFF